MRMHGPADDVLARARALRELEHVAVVAAVDRDLLGRLRVQDRERAGHVDRAAPVRRARAEQRPDHARLRVRPPQVVVQDPEQRGRVHAHRARRAPAQIAASGAAPRARGTQGRSRVRRSCCCRRIFEVQRGRGDADSHGGGKWRRKSGRHTLPNAEMFNCNCFRRRIVVHICARFRSVSSFRRPLRVVRHNFADTAVVDPVDLQVQARRELDILHSPQCDRDRVRPLIVENALRDREFVLRPTILSARGIQRDAGRHN
jgi:hypothetical protein